MYMNILKKDLKRKKTMNIILLLFIAISAMFTSSSVNNIITVMDGLDNYFEKAGMSDYFLLATEKDGESSLEKIIKNEKSVEKYRKESGIVLSSENFKKNGKNALNFSNSALVIPVSQAKLKYFDSDNNEITEVKKGEIMLTSFCARNSDLKIGDKFEVKWGDVSIEVKFAGILKDALFGSEMMGNPRFLLNDEDYEKLNSDKSAPGYGIGIYYVDTNNEKSFTNAIADDPTIIFDASLSLVRTTYVMNIMVAGLLLIISVCLILVSFVVLKFTIGFTIAEEFREIGVMKAIGIKNNYIRCLYLVKYLGISIVGAFIGFFAGIPFGKMLLSGVSQSMMIENEKTVFINILCCIAVVAIILLFCFSSTSKIKNMSPIDAVRNGQTGERFKKKSPLSLGKSHLSSTLFLPVNDILSNKKQFGIITLVFTFCVMLVIILANTANTLTSDKLLFLFGTTPSDVYYSNAEKITKVIAGEQTLDEGIEDIEKTLEENNMPADVHVETMYKLPVTFKGKKDKIMFQQCKVTKAYEYTYDEGTPPKYKNEIALSKPAAEKIGAKIGDSVNMTINGKEDEYIITALFQSFNQLGESGRLHEDAPTVDKEISSAMSFQIDFNDKPDDETIKERIEKLKTIFDTDKIFDKAEFVKDCTGAADIINGVKNLVLIMSVIIIAMISILMEKSFISKEKPEIALMKALGIKNSTIISVHTLRFVIISFTASIIAAAVSTPITKFAVDPIFAMMGAVSGVEYAFKPLETFLIYPVISIAAASLGAFFTALSTHTIKASDTSNIE